MVPLDSIVLSAYKKGVVAMQMAETLGFLKFCKAPKFLNRRNPGAQNL